MKAYTGRLAWSLAALSLFVTCAGIALALLNPAGLPLNDPNGSAWIDYLESLMFPIVGALVAWKQPHNPVGWMLLLYSLAQATVVLISAYAQHGVLIDPGSLPGAGGAAWASTWLWILPLLLIPLVLLHFPNGRLPSPGWRWFRRLCGLPAALLVAPALAWLGKPARKYFLLEGGNLLGEEWAAPLLTGVFATLLLSVLVSLLSMVVRYRRSGQKERQQLKWIMLAVGLLVASGVWEGFLPGFSHLQAAVGAVAFAGIPASMGIAVLRYRLYDIDLIINRALVYGALTAALALVYVGGVVAVGAIVRAVTGQESNNLAVAASTLAVAALFGPLRRSVQSFIDRSFYRRKYDAEQTLANFSARLREQVDLDSVNTELVTIVTRTIQPSHISLWLRPPGA